MKSILCLIWHRWISTILVINTLRKVTRLERKCKRCETRQILLSQFPVRAQKVIIGHFQKTEEYYSYKRGDWLDHYTRSVLIHRIDDE